MEPTANAGLIVAKRNRRRARRCEDFHFLKVPPGPCLLGPRVVPILVVAGYEVFAGSVSARSHIRHTVKFDLRISLIHARHSAVGNTANPANPASFYTTENLVTPSCGSVDPRRIIVVPLTITGSSTWALSRFPTDFDVATRLGFI
jgi:hypothetical protein